MADDIYPPDFGTDRGKVRALLPDVEQVDFSGEGVPEYLFSDSHIDALLATARGRTGGRARIYRAAALGLRAIAVSEALIAKVIKTEDLQTDGAKLATALMGGAKGLDDQADKDEEAEDEWSYGFQVVDFQPQPADCLPYGMRGFPSCCGTAGTGGGCGCGSYDHGAGFGRWV
jgi:hypothetical protein